MKSKYPIPAKMRRYYAMQREFSGSIDDHCYYGFGSEHEDEDKKYCKQYTDASTTPRDFMKDGVHDLSRWQDVKIPRKLIKCPECGRKVFARIGFCHDGCCVYYDLPRHKPKGWYKKKKKTSKDDRTKRRK